ncbi:GNAT family N-acetyltransferase [Methanohalobium sp.]|uniref:GNAT family N-acetyltransferase n=1 Tax=Methanohalobium sp. TaxID=2837493 RepID=UPI0025FE1C6F|nr:GNAT family N-acetyltransferase [Methanohalobium sp.]
MIELAKSNNGTVFCVLEFPSELDKLNVGNFTYFNKHLGMSDYSKNFKSWINRQNAVLITTLLNNTVIGWTMAEKWSYASSDGKPVYVLRGIEISSSKKGNGYGKILLDILSMVLPGHIITKPVNKSAKNFFFSLNFKYPEDNSPVNLGNHPGYLILHDSYKTNLYDENVEFLTDTITKCRNKFYSKRLIGNHGCCTCETLQSNFAMDSQYQDTADTYKLMSPCVCGEFRARRYKNFGGREGESIICSNCGKERYFLPEFKDEN